MTDKFLMYAWASSAVVWVLIWLATWVTGGDRTEPVQFALISLLFFDAAKERVKCNRG